MARPRRVRTTDSRHDLPIAPNLLGRNFIAAAPNRIWLADITYSAPRSEKSERHMFGMQ
jgi:putative transposase